MCGIFGYTGPKEAQDLVINGLKHLEYRGYDSSGIAVQNGTNKILLERAHGKIKNLEEALKKNRLNGHTAIAHTRWATHGAPSKENAHPHLDTQQKIAVVHNGIIENHFELRQKLEDEGFVFRSQTDTEVITHLIAKYYKGNLEQAVARAIKDLRGTYAIAVICSEERGKIVAAKMDSPLVVGYGKNENFLASDAAAFLDHTKRVVFLENGEIVTLTENTVKINNSSNKAISREPKKISWSLEQAQKAGFEHFMLKEIFEQPGIIQRTTSARVQNNTVHFDELKNSPGYFKKVKRIVIIACGTAYHAGLTAKYIFETFTPLPVWVDTASEFRYRDPAVDKNTLVIAVSQSGETADTLAVVQEDKAKKAMTMAICNVLDSSIAREADKVLYTHAGPEIAVASTKAYTAQLALFYLLGLYLARVFNSLSPNQVKQLLKEFSRLPRLMQEVLDRYKKDEAEWAKNAHDFHMNYNQNLERYFSVPAKDRKRAPNSFFLYLGRNINFPNALEGALKLKEISYISAEGYPAGEMKHGPIALIDENPWVICIMPESKTYDKMFSNVQEIKARRGIVVPIVTQGDTQIRKVDPRYVIEIPKSDEIFSPLLTILPLQLIAYCVAREFGEDIDQPRNLAKSVTVE